MLLDDYKNVNKKLTSEEVEKELIMQEDFEAIVEWLVENNYAELCDNYSIYNEATYTTKKPAGVKMVRTKEHLINHAMIMSALGQAKANQDADYRELQKTVYKRRKLLDKILNKYKSSAKKSAKELLKTAARVSGSTIKDKSKGAGGTKDTPNKAKVIGEKSK